MSFKISELNAFSKATLGPSDNAIAIVTGGGRIVQKNTYWTWVGKIFRMSGAKNANNAVRTELMSALGRAFDLDGIGNNSEGKTTFSQKFMDRLSELLGDDFKRENRASWNKVDVIGSALVIGLVLAAYAYFWTWLD